MPYVSCPTCGERGKIPTGLIGVRIKCKQCGLSFLVAPPATKAVGAASAAAPVGAAAMAAAGPSAAVEAHGIEVEGLDASSWALPTEAAMALKAETDHATHAHAQSRRPPRHSSQSPHPPGPRVQDPDAEGQILRREIRPGPPGRGPQPLQPPGMGHQVHADTAHQGVHRCARRDHRRLARALQGRRIEPFTNPVHIATDLGVGRGSPILARSRIAVRKPDRGSPSTAIGELDPRLEPSV